jgi:GT2 family glycosyltransferase
MTISLKNLSAVIVSFHSEDVIHNCIKSITDKIQIIVVENSGNKDFARKLEDKYKNVKCIISRKNLGMGAGNNLGIRKVKTDYVFILNPDIILEKNAIKEISIASKKIGTFGLIAPISKNKKYPNYKINNTSKSFNNIDPFKVESIDGFAMILNLKKLKKNKPI